MIEKMTRYNFILLGGEEEKFLADLQELGVVDITRSFKPVDDASNQEYYEALKAAGQEAYYIHVPGAQHAYYDWKPDSRTKETFLRFGAPYARQMEDFFNTVFYQ